MSSTELWPSVSLYLCRSVSAYVHCHGPLTYARCTTQALVINVVPPKGEFSEFMLPRRLYTDVQLLATS